MTMSLCYFVRVVLKRKSLFGSSAVNVLIGVRAQRLRSRSLWTKSGNPQLKERST